MYHRKKKKTNVELIVTESRGWLPEARGEEKREILIKGGVQHGDYS